MRSIEPDERDDKFIFYDFECQQDNELNQHIPNYVVSHSTCDECEKNEVTSNSKCYKCGSRCDMCNQYNSELKEYEKMPCNDCGFRQVIFSGADTKEDFCKWLFTKSHRGYTVVAHNARGYDSYFLYDHLMLTGNRPDPVIFSGSKIMYMHVQNLNLRLLDSLNFLPMPLAKLPKSFGLKEKKKGFFPHFFNTKENENVVLPSLPDMHYYDPDSMSKERRSEFLIWYEENKNKPFDFQKEMKEYCISDVDILLNAYCKFRELVKGSTDEKINIEDVHNLIFKTIYQNAVDPFAFLTIASVCLGVFRSKFLEETWLVLTKEDHSKQLLDFHIMNEKVILLEYKNTDDFDPSNNNTNVLISAFCTCWARLDLWNIMNSLGNRVLYHDTDSIIFSVSDKDSYIPELGDYLGQLTNELSCKEIGCRGCDEGHWITEFVSCGPKNYSFKLNSGQIMCKVRGFSLNYRNSQIVNFQSMKDTLFAWKKGENVDLVTVTTEICRHKYENPMVYTRQVAKKYNVVYNKRRVLDNFTTVPYGYFL